MVAPGEIAAGDPIVVESRPDHEVTIAVTFRALTVEPQLLPRLLAAGSLPPAVREKATRRTAGQRT